MLKTDNWTQIPLSPLSGILDSRSRPAELSPGSFRYKLNFAINRTGALCVQSGYRALNFGPRTDTPSAVPNWDAHRVGEAREPITFLFESTAPNGVRRLFRGTKNSLWVLDNNTSEWTQITYGWSTAVWKAAPVGNTITFTGNVQAPGAYGVKYHTLGSGSVSDILADSTVFRARVAIAFAGFALLMNVRTLGGGDQPARAMWSDYQAGYDFRTGAPRVSGFKDLDYGDEILNAAEMLGALYIFTRSSIWRCTVNPNPDPTTPSLLFQKIYSEPKNQAGCLVYPQTLVTTGRELYWWSHDSVWTFNPYLVAPESTEWLLKGSGATFSDDNADRAEIRCCETIIGEYRPKTREIRYSFPAALDADSPVCINTRELVLNVEYRTMHLSDHGFSSYVNQRKTPEGVEDCNSGQTFIAASTADYCLKDLALDVFYCENVTLIGGDRAADIPDASYATTRSGYYARAIGLAPFGYPNIEKTVRELLLDHDIKPNDLISPNLITLRVGNHFNLVDPASTEPRCSPNWHVQDSLPLKCPDEATVAAMLAENERPSDPLAFTMWEVGNRIYWDVRITSADGSAPMYHDAAFSAFRFDVMLG